MVRFSIFQQTHRQFSTNQLTLKFQNFQFFPSFTINSLSPIQPIPCWQRCKTMHKPIATHSIAFWSFSAPKIWTSGLTSLLHVLFPLIQFKPKLKHLKVSVSKYINKYLNVSITLQFILRLHHIFSRISLF